MTPDFPYYLRLRPMRAKIHFQAGRSRNSRRGLAAVGIMLGVALTLGLPTAGGRTLPVPFANDYLAENWGLDEGFPENSCSGIVTAPDGAMWMGTFRGLVRFNGQKFSSWAPAALPELKSVTIYNLFRDKRGRIWISTAEGLTMCDQGVWRRWQENDGWGNRAVFARSYAEAPDGTLVIARSTGRVMQLEAGGVWRELPVPAGTGGTMCAFDDTGALYAVRSGAAGMLDGGRLVMRPPFREPHHSASQAALTGGGQRAKPGEVSLAHRGVLFLDELPEFPRVALEALRQPMESGRTTVARAMASASRRPLGTTAPTANGRRSQRRRKSAVPARESLPCRDSNVGIISRLADAAAKSTGKSSMSLLSRLHRGTGDTRRRAGFVDGLDMAHLFERIDQRNVDGGGIGQGLHEHEQGP